MRAKTASYTDEFRAEAVAMYRSSDRAMRQVAADLGVNRHTFEEWVRQDNVKRKKVKPRDVAKTSSNETLEEKVARLEKENAKLERRNAQLEMDRAILKKAAAFFAKESE
jgi:transposase